MSLEHTAAIAKQLAFEMNIPYGSYLDEAVETWLQELRRNVICYKELEVSMVQTWIGTCYGRRVAAPQLLRWRYRNRTQESAQRG